MLFDSLNEQRSRLSNHLKDIRGLLYLLPSILKHVGYYQEMKLEPHATPFTVESMHSDVIPQQDDGYVWSTLITFYALYLLS